MSVSYSDGDVFIVEDEGSVNASKLTTSHDCCDLLGDLLLRREFERVWFVFIDRTRVSGRAARKKEMVLLFPLYFVAAQVSTMSPFCKLFVGAKMDSMAYHPWLVESICQWWARITVTYFHVKINSKEDSFFLFFCILFFFFFHLSFF